ncbi:MAG TPA: SCP2 sterol-binding domain-containing protein [Acidimicrobiales bacterium]|nr:SCP2 sterol-binding domain-containing protein [Acidimicrobiales bacterium]
MADFASPDWIRALDEAVQASGALREATSDVSLTLRQTLTDRDDGDVSWHIVVDHGSVRVHPGPGDHADVTFTQDDETARAIGAGTISVQTAFMIGRLRIGGDTAMLMEHAAAFDSLADLFDELRATTTY